jgi:hypothetical protein
VRVVLNVGNVLASGSTFVQLVLPALYKIKELKNRPGPREMHVAFQIPYVYDYITKSCRQQVEVIQNHENENVRYVGQGEARDGK